MKQIQRKNLPHTATYKAYTGNSGEEDTYDTPIPLNYVKIEEKTQYKYTNNGKEIVGNALMFYDYVNSTGLSDKPKNESIITFNGRDYHVVDTEILCGNSSIPHHYEVMLK